MSASNWWVTKRHLDAFKKLTASAHSQEEWMQAIEIWRKKVAPKETSRKFYNRCYQKAHNDGFLRDELNKTNWFALLEKTRQEQFKLDWRDIDKFPKLSDLFTAYPTAETIHNLKYAAYFY